MQDHRRISDEFPIATIAFDRSIEVNHAVLEMELASFFHTGSLITWLRVLKVMKCSSQTSQTFSSCR